ncbi:MAG: A24 family peptidase [Pseudomonadales bacterium]|nr:A24 family peptidase [Pseudomonadales bacterium]
MDFIVTLQNNPLAFYICVGILGLLIGSFLNVVIYRLPVMMERDWQEQAQELLAEFGKEEANSDTQNPEYKGETEAFNLLVPASTCPKCDHKIKPWENIPVISYLFLFGKCSQCKCPISPRYPILEAVTAILSVTVAQHFGFGWQTALALLLTWSLITLTMIDFDHKLLPDTITLPLMWLGLLVNIQGHFVPLDQAVIGAAAGYLSLWSVFWIFKLATGKDGMGYGDFKLLAAFGAWFGWKTLPIIIVGSSMVGALVGITLILVLGRDKNIPIPFGPYLAAAGWIAMLWGDIISSTYFRFAL